MGSSNSKSFDPDTAVTTPVAARHRRSYSRNVFQSSCVRPASGSPDSSDIDKDDTDDEQISHPRAKENNTEGHSAKESTSKLKGKVDRDKNGKVKLPDERACVSSELQLVEWGEPSLSDSVSQNGCSSSRNLSSRFLSRFSFFPGNISSRLGRATSLRFLRAESSTSSTMSNDEELQASRYGNRNKTPQGCEFFPSCFMPMSPGHEDENSGSDNSEISSIQELARDTRNGINREDSNANLCSPRTAFGVDGMEIRHVDRRNEAREPVERNFQFSRTLSVGRLRDRVIRRSAPGLSCPLQPGEEVVDNNEGHEVRSHVSNEDAAVPTPSSNYSTAIASSSLHGSQDFDVETNHVREARYHDLLEHRSNFLERRRRIRSQVRALQRMGSRFENLSGHERSCILTGQHRTGHCACRHNNHDANDGTNARASISRIVLLAEALFEVLDEIHQQSVALSSRPSLSSIGSVPAPNEVVEALPLKLYRKSRKQLNEEDAQCYICLVEYEDGDEVRVLPCHHEFHRLCIDKWLKEIHRICPLCRGDVCKSD